MEEVYRVLNNIEFNLNHQTKLGYKVVALYEKTPYRLILIINKVSLKKITDRNEIELPAGLKVQYF